MRPVLVLLLVAALVAAIFLPTWAQEMVNGSKQLEVPTASLKAVGAAPIGPGEIVVVWQVTEGDRSALIVLYVWAGGRELVVMPW